MGLATVLGLWIAAAWASPLDGFVEGSDAPVLALMQCSPAAALHRWMDGQDDLGGFGLVDEVGRGTLGEHYDIDAPLFAAVVATEVDPRALLLEFGVTDPEAVAPALAAAAVDGPLSTPGTSFTQHGDRVTVLVERETDLEVTGLESRGGALAERVATLDVTDGCGLVVHLGELMTTPDGRSMIPVPIEVQTLQLIFARPDRVTHAILDMSAPPAPLLEVLDGIGVPGLTEVRSHQDFPLVIQLHADVREALAALSLLSPGRQGMFLSMLAGSIPPRIRTGKGIVVATGGSDKGGLFVIPMESPRGPRKLMRLVRYLAREAGAEYDKAGPRRATLFLDGKPPLTVGARKGLVAVALRSEVVDEVLSDSGTPLLPTVTGPYGVRISAEPGRFSQVGGLGGVLEARYLDGALHLTAQPRTGAEEAP